MSEGDGVFINSKVLHQIKPVITGSVVINVAFNTTLIGGHTLSHINKKYIYPIINNSSVEFMILDSTAQWKKDIITGLFKIYALYEENDFGYELSIKNSLCTLWLTLAGSLIPTLKPPNTLSEYEGERLNLMLDYIQNNF